MGVPFLDFFGMRNCSLARVIMLGVCWMVLLILIGAISVGDAASGHEPECPGTEIHVMLRIPGGRWFLVGPPVLLLLIWYWAAKIKAFSS